LVRRQNHIVNVVIVTGYMLNGKYKLRQTQSQNHAFNVVSVSTKSVNCVD